MKRLTILAIAAAAVTTLVLLPSPAHSACSGVTVPAGFDCQVFVDPAGIGNTPTGMTFDSSGNLYYTTFVNATIKVVDSTGTPVTTIVRTDTTPFPWDVIFDSAGTLYLSDINANTTSGSNDGAVFRDPAVTNTVIAQGFPDNTTIPTGDDAGMAFPAGNNVTAGFSAGNLYVANFSPGPTLGGPGGGGSSGIFRIDDPAGTPSASVFLNTTGNIPPASNAHPIADAMALAFGPGGSFGNDLYVTDPNLCESGTPACDPGGTDPQTINDGAIYTVNSSANVTLFAGGTGDVLEDPRDLVFSSGGLFGTVLYVTDSVTGKVVNIDSTGAISDFATGLTSPGALTFGPDGCLYVTETGSSTDPNRIIQICRADDGVTVFDDQPEFVNDTGAVVVPIPDSETAFPGTSCGSGPDPSNSIPHGGDLTTSAQVVIVFDSNMLTITQDLTAPGNASRGLCIFDPGFTPSLSNTNPNAFPVPLLVGNGEDDYLVVFDTPVNEVGFQLLTNDQADEIVTLKDASNAVIATLDINALTGTNTRQFVGFQSATPIKSVLIDTFEGFRQNEGIDEIKLVLASVVQVDIDIKPGSDPNSINCENEREVIAVAILTNDFDATTVDHTTVMFEGAHETHVDRRSGEPRRHEEDVDDDGDTDLVFHFRLGDTGLTCGSTEGTLTGETFDGQAIEGMDAVRMIGNQ